MPATTPISYLLDENVDVRLSDVLVRAGAVVTRVPQGASDKQVFALAVKTGSILLTNDTAFTNTLLYPAAKTAGIIVFSVHPPTLTNLTAAMNRLEIILKSADLRGKLCVISAQNIAIQQ